MGKKKPRHKKENGPNQQQRLTIALLVKAILDIIVTLVNLIERMLE